MYGIFMLLLLIFSTKVLIIINMQHLVWCTTPSHLRLVVCIIMLQHLVRDVYKTLLDQAEEFIGFDVKYVNSHWYCFVIILVSPMNDVRCRFTETENQNVLRKLISETKALDDSILFQSYKRYLHS